MLYYDFVFKKGILFINLNGDITKKTSKLFSKEIDPLIIENGIKNVVFNFKNLSRVSSEGIFETYKNILILSKEADVSFSEIPIYLRKKFKILLKNFKEIEDYI